MPTVSDSGGTVVAAVKNLGVAATTTDNALVVVTMSPNSAGGGGGATTAAQGTPTTLANAWPVRLVDATNARAATVTVGGAVLVDGSATTQPVSGTVTANQGTAAAAPWITTTGGTVCVAVAAGVATTTTIKTGSGMLCRVLVTTLAGAVTTVFYDNASAASGKIVGLLPASAPAGTLVDFSMPVTNGITVGGNALNPAMTISYY